MIATTSLAEKVLFISLPILALTILYQSHIIRNSKLSKLDYSQFKCPSSNTDLQSTHINTTTGEVVCIYRIKTSRPLKGK